MRFFEIMRRPGAALGIAVTVIAVIFVALRWSDTHFEQSVVDCGPTDATAEGKRTDYVFQILTKPIPEDACDQLFRQSQPPSSAPR
jgi:hypothetical protein